MALQLVTLGTMIVRLLLNALSLSSLAAMEHKKPGVDWSQNKDKLYAVVNKIEKKCLPSKILGDTLTTTQQALLFRAWQSSLTVPLQLCYKLAQKHGLLLSDAQDQGSELIELAKLTSNLHILHAGKVLAFDHVTELTTSSLAALRSTPTYRLKKKFLEAVVYKSNAPVGLRILIRAVSYIIFNSLGCVLNSPTLKLLPCIKSENQMIRFAEIFSTANAVFTDYLRHCLEWVVKHEPDADWNIYFNKLGVALTAAVEIESSSFEEYLGDILSADQLKLFKRNLERIHHRIERILDGDLNPDPENSFEDYFSM